MQNKLQSSVALPVGHYMVCCLSNLRVRLVVSLCAEQIAILCSTTYWALHGVLFNQSES